MRMSQDCAEKVFQQKPDGFYFLGIDWGGQGRAEIEGGAKPCSLGTGCRLSRSPGGPFAERLHGSSLMGTLPLPCHQEPPLLPQLTPLIAEEEG